MITVFKYVKTCSKGESKCFFMAKERRINGFKGNLEQTLAKKTLFLSVRLLHLWNRQHGGGAPPSLRAFYAGCLDVLGQVYM